MSTDSKTNTRAPDFRYLAVDAFGLNFTDNGVKLLLGIEDMNNIVLEQLGISLSLKSAKLLSILLHESIRSYEEKTGQEIALDQAKLDELYKVFKRDEKQDEKQD